MFSSQDSSGTAAYSSFSLPDVSDELLPTQSTVQQSQSVLDSASPMLLGAVGDNKPNPKSPAVETEAEEQSAASVRSPPEKTVDASVEETVNAQSSSANRKKLIACSCCEDLTNGRHSIFPASSCYDFGKIATGACQAS